MKTNEQQNLFCIIHFQHIGMGLIIGTQIVGEKGSWISEYLYSSEGKKEILVETP
jgi:hypothetical protein